jgi:hypothetical protein
VERIKMVLGNEGLYDGGNEGAAARKRDILFRSKAVSEANRKSELKECFMNKVMFYVCISERDKFGVFQLLEQGVLSLDAVKEKFPWMIAIIQDPEVWDFLKVSSLEMGFAERGHATKYRVARSMSEYQYWEVVGAPEKDIW